MKMKENTDKYLFLIMFEKIICYCIILSFSDIKKNKIKKKKKYGSQYATLFK